MHPRVAVSVVTVLAEVQCHGLLSWADTHLHCVLPIHRHTTAHT